MELERDREGSPSAEILSTFWVPLERERSRTYRQQQQQQQARSQTHERTPLYNSLSRWQTQRTLSSTPVSSSSNEESVTCSRVRQLAGGGCHLKCGHKVTGGENQAAGISFLSSVVEKEVKLHTGNYVGQKDWMTPHLTLYSPDPIVNSMLILPIRLLEVKKRATD